MSQFSEYQPEEFLPEQFSRQNEEERKQKEFRDFLLVQEIAGTLRGVPHSSRVPSELLIDTGGQVEISEEFSEDEDHNSSTVLVHRNRQGDISSVEVLCACGRKTLIKFRYEEASQ